MPFGERQIIKGGSKALGQFFGSARSRLSSAPILIIEGGETSANSSGTCETLAGRQVEFFLAHKLGLRTVVSKGGGGLGASHSSVKNAMFYTEQILQEQLELAARVGASTVCAVGNRTAMDLAKAIATSSTHTLDTHMSSRTGGVSLEEIFLVPNTYDAVLSCTFPYSLSLHSEQDLILAKPTTDSVKLPPTTIAPLETKLFEPKGQLAKNMQIALRACLALSLDKDPDTDVSNIEDLLRMTSGSDDEDGIDSIEKLHDQILQQILGVDVTFGFGTNARSLPLAIAVSLLPTTFADQEFLALMARCLPSNEMDPILTTESVDMLWSHVRENQVQWNCYDAPAQKLRQALELFTLLPDKQ